MAPIQPLPDFELPRKDSTPRPRQKVNSRLPRQPARCFRPPAIDVRAIRAKSKLTKAQFASCFGIPAETLRHWERGDRKPHGAALVLLHVIDQNPRAVIRALGSPFHIPVPGYIPI